MRRPHAEREEYDRAPKVLLTLRVRYNAGSPRTRHVDDLSRNGPLPGRPAALAGIEILDLHSGQRVVAVIEVVSPSNKCPGPGRDAYLAKQREIMGSTSHLIEIDLLRAGEHVVSVPSWLVARRAPYDYLRGSYRARINYAAPCRPPLAPDNQAWAQQLCGQAAGMGL